MQHHTPLIATLVVGIVLALGFGMAAHRPRASPLVGYLLAGIAVGPFTPGFVADQPLADGLADVGVTLLLFVLGLHFSPRDLLAVRAVALPGALAEIALMTSLGMGLAWGFGWGFGAGLVFGLSLSVASTVVLTRALQERRILRTDRGRTAVGWLVVEDLAVVLALVLLPAAAGALAGGGAPVSGWGLAAALGLTLANAAVGVVRARELLAALLDGQTPDVRSLVRPAPVVPDTADAFDVLATLREAEVPMALVHDEHGHFAGIVTPADLTEAIVGAFRSDADLGDEPMAVEREDGSWLLAGSMPVDEMAEHLNIAHSAERAYQTVAGFVFSRWDGCRGSAMPPKNRVGGSRWWT